MPPGWIVDPPGRITPEEPGIALMVSLPIVAIAVADVGTDIDGVMTGGSGGLLGGLAGLVGAAGASGGLLAGFDGADGGSTGGVDFVGAAAGGLVSRTGVVVGTALGGSYVKVYGEAGVVGGNRPLTGGTAPGGSKTP